jgi:hypothetical protein
MVISASAPGVVVVVVVAVGVEELELDEQPERRRQKIAIKERSGKRIQGRRRKSLRPTASSLQRPNFCARSAASENPRQFLRSNVIAGGHRLAFCEPSVINIHVQHRETSVHLYQAKAIPGPSTLRVKSEAPALTEVASLQ